MLWVVSTTWIVFQFFYSFSRQALTDEKHWWVREMYPLNSFLFQNTINQVPRLLFHVLGIFAVLRPGNHPIDPLLLGTHELSSFTCLKNCRQCWRPPFFCFPNRDKAITWLIVDRRSPALGVRERHFRPKYLFDQTWKWKSWQPYSAPSTEC